MGGLIRKMIDLSHLVWSGRKYVVEEIREEFEGAKRDMDRLVDQLELEREQNILEDHVV